MTPNRRAINIFGSKVSNAHRYFGTAPLDYPKLARWCKARKGQVIVCERPSATWLPFAPLYTAPTSRRLHTATRRTCKEAVWLGP